MTLKNIAGKIHLWLGLSSGAIIVLLGITGCILAYEQEIRELTQPALFVQPRPVPYLAPDTLRQIAENALAGKKINALEYPGEGRSAIASWYDSADYFTVSLNPYSGQVQEVRNMNRDFFRIVLDGHYYLWLPPAIGRPVVASATLVFLMMLITGLVLWWPRTKAARKQRFKVKWNARWRRLNYDLHQVLGFYISWAAVLIAVSGLVWGFDWFARSVYRVTSAGKPLPAYVQPLSDTTRSGIRTASPVNQAWAKHLRGLPAGESIAVYFALGAADPVQVIVNHRPGTYYDTETWNYDQYTGAELHATSPGEGPFSRASVAEQIRRLNYDVHTGGGWGLAGKTIAFFASGVAASLPITGFYIWWGRKKKKKHPAPGPAYNAGLSVPAQQSLLPPVTYL